LYAKVTASNPPEQATNVFTKGSLF